MTRVSQHKVTMNLFKVIYSFSHYIYSVSHYIIYSKTILHNNNHLNTEKSPFFMAEVKVEYDPNSKQAVYTITVKPTSFAVETAATFKEDFEGCIDFITEQFAGLKLVPHLESFKLEIRGKLPRNQKRILERLVDLNNRAPELYQAFQNPDSFKSLSTYFGHSEPPKR